MQSFETSFFLFLQNVFYALCVCSMMDETDFVKSLNHIKSHAAGSELDKPLKCRSRDEVLEGKGEKEEQCEPTYTL